MPHPIIETGECIACGTCVNSCPAGVLELDGDLAVVSDADACVDCGVCMESCPTGAITEINED